ncbi:MAG TPA: MarC family protein, partial [Rhodocyclaceae bacterium]|nr:MarC family protein [Rhodocyclaceae bacterium]
MTKTFLLSFAAIFFIVDPIGLVPIFLSMTARDSPQKCRRMAWRACLTASVVLVFFALAGALVLEIFSLTLGAFRVAGGLLLLLTSLDMLRAKHAATRTSPEEEQEGVGDQHGQQNGANHRRAALPGAAVLRDQHHRGGDGAGAG